MEEVNPWLDPDSGTHKNKKSVKPVKQSQEEYIVPGTKKDDNVKNLDFLKTLVEDGLETTLPKPVEDWIEENFDTKWKEEFLSDIKVLKDELLKSPYYPSHKYMLLLKYIFLLQQGY